MEILNQILLFNLILFALLLGAQIIYRVRAHSLQYALSSLDEQRPELFCELRIRRAKNNQAEFLLLLIPIVFAVNFLALNIDNIADIAISILLGRSTYLICTLVGIAYLRSVTWLIGFLAWVYLLVKVTIYTLT